MLGRLTAQELALWQAYYRLDPWGGKRLDLNAAMVASCVVNMLRAKGPGVDPAKLVLSFGEERKRQTPEQMERALVACTLRAGGKVR